MIKIAPQTPNKHCAYGPYTGEQAVALSAMDLGEYKQAMGETKFGMTSGPLVMEFISRRIRKLARRVDQYNCPANYPDQSKWVEGAIRACWQDRRLARDTGSTSATPRAVRL